jgi:hypothetical protein
VVTKPIISLGVMTRVQIDLIDMRTRPDKISPDIVYGWILNCIDRFSKFCWRYALKNKSTNEVALKLRDLFFVFGPPRILHSDNGREFVSGVITELKTLFPDLVFIRGQPRHPQSQGCIERANGVLCDALGKWMCSNNSSRWSSALLPVTYRINTRMSTVTKITPYETMFGQASCSDSDFSKLVYENGIDDEQDLPAAIAELNDDLIVNKEDNQINLDKGIDGERIALFNQLSNDVFSSLIKTSSTLKTPLASAITTIPTRHCANRIIASNYYLASANKKMKLYKDSLNLMSNNYNVNDCVGIEIHSVDRANRDPTYLPCVIVEKFEKNNIFLFK